MAVKHLDGLRIQGRSDDSSGAVDGLGSDADATLNGAVASSDSAIYGKNSLSFDGTDDTVNLGNDLDAVFSTSGEFTFSCWAYMPNATSSGNKTIISKPATTSWSSPHHSFTVQHTGGNIDFQTNDGSDASNTTVACGAGWHFIVITKTSSNVWVLKIDNNTSSTVTLSPTMGTQDWIVGNTPYNSRFFDGKLQDVAFWSRVLTSAEQTILYGTKSGVGNATSSATGVVATGVSQTSLRAYYTLNDTTTGVTNSATATDESKTSITNMAIGTRYEETDTRKIFRFKATSGSGDVTWDTATNSGMTISGNTVTGTSASSNEWRDRARTVEEFYVGSGLATITWKVAQAGLLGDNEDMGFGSDPFYTSGDASTYIDYRMHFPDSPKYIQILENNVSKGTNFGTWRGSQSGNWSLASLQSMTIDKDGIVRYYLAPTGGSSNLSLIYTSLIPIASGTLMYGHAVAKSSGDSIVDVTYDFPVSWVEKGT